jgi:hypothetical protein
LKKLGSEIFLGFFFDFFGGGCGFGGDGEVGVGGGCMKLVWLERGDQCGHFGAGLRLYGAVLSEI